MVRRRVHRGFRDALVNDVKLALIQGNVVVACLERRAGIVGDGVLYLALGHSGYAAGGSDFAHFSVDKSVAAYLYVRLGQRAAIISLASTLGGQRHRPLRDRQRSRLRATDDILICNVISSSVYDNKLRLIPERKVIRVDILVIAADLNVVRNRRVVNVNSMTFLQAAHIPCVVDAIRSGVVLTVIRHAVVIANNRENLLEYCRIRGILLHVRRRIRIRIGAGYGISIAVNPPGKLVSSGGASRGAFSILTICHGLASHVDRSALLRHIVDSQYLFLVVQVHHQGIACTRRNRDVLRSSAYILVAILQSLRVHIGSIHGRTNPNARNGFSSILRIGAAILRIVEVQRNILLDIRNVLEANDIIRFRCRQHKRLVLVVRIVILDILGHFDNAFIPGGLFDRVCQIHPFIVRIFIAIVDRILQLGRFRINELNDVLCGVSIQQERLLQRVRTHIGDRLVALLNGLTPHSAVDNLLSGDRIAFCINILDRIGGCRLLPAGVNNLHAAIDRLIDAVRRRAGRVCIPARELIAGARGRGFKALLLGKLIADIKRNHLRIACVDVIEIDLNLRVLAHPACIELQVLRRHLGSIPVNQGLAGLFHVPAGECIRNVIHRLGGLANHPAIRLIAAQLLLIRNVCLRGHRRSALGIEGKIILQSGVVNLCIGVIFVRVSAFKALKRFSSQA